MKKGSTHSQLNSRFARFCATRQIDGADINSRLPDLKQRIVSYRTDAIEHVSGPPLLRGTAWNPPENLKIYMADQSTEDLSVLLERVDEYLVSMLDFMRDQARHSMLEGYKR